MIGVIECQRNYWENLSTCKFRIWRRKQSVFIGNFSCVTKKTRLSKVKRKNLCFRFCCWENECPVCYILSRNIINNKNHYDNQYHNLCLQHWGFFFCSIWNILAKKIRLSWNWNDKMSNDNVLPALIKSTSTFAATIADWRHLFRRLCQQLANDQNLPLTRWVTYLDQENQAILIGSRLALTFSQNYSFVSHIYN